LELRRQSAHCKHPNFQPGLSKTNLGSRTGINITASTFLLPLGVVLYTFVGGIKATFLTDYMHTSIILIIACFFTIKALSVSEVSSIGHLYDLAKNAGFQHPVSGNKDGSYFTMTSKGVCDNFGSEIRIILTSLGNNVWHFTFLR